MNRERGGTVTVNGYLLILLLAAGIASGATNFWLAAHHVIELSIFPCGRSHTTTADHPSTNI